jgi:hypothetical protein
MSQRQKTTHNRHSDLKHQELFGAHSVEKPAKIDWPKFGRKPIRSELHPVLGR